MNNLSTFQRIYYQTQLRRAIEIEVNPTTLFRVLNNIILYTYRFGTPFIYTSETTTANFFDELFETAEQLYETLNGDIREGFEVVFDTLAFVAPDLFLTYINNYTGIHQYLAWSENIFIFNVYTVRAQGSGHYTDNLFVSITDLFNLTTEIIKVSIRRQ